MEACFYIFSFFIISIISFTIWKFDAEQKTKTFFFPLFFLIFLFVVGVLSSKNFYFNFDLPPRLVYAGILPSFAILAFLSFSKKGKRLLLNVPYHLPILFQSFRIIVELLIYWTFLKGWGPKHLTMLGYNYEFYFGVGAIFFGLWVKLGKPSKRIIIAWNVIGLCFLAFIVGLFITTGFLWDSLWDSSEPLLTIELFQMPSVLIATFFMPIAVWVHIFSIRQNLLK